MSTMAFWQFQPISYVNLLYSQVKGINNFPFIATVYKYSHIVTAMFCVSAHIHTSLDCHLGVVRNENGVKKEANNKLDPNSLTMPILVAKYKRTIPFHPGKRINNIEPVSCSHGTSTSTSTSTSISLINRSSYALDVFFSK